MALSDNRRLFDLTIRHALYVEGVKLYMAQDFNSVLRELSEEFSKLLGRVRYRTLDGLSKAELNKLLVSLRKSQLKIYSVYTETLIAQLREFMRADLSLTRRVYAASLFTLEDNKEVEESEIAEDDDKAIEVIKEENKNGAFVPLFGSAGLAKDGDRMWSGITNAPMPANGLFLLPFVKLFAASAQASVENLVRKAWANKWTVEKLTIELMGLGAVTQNPQGISNALGRIRTQLRAVVNTAVQHISGWVIGVVQSLVYRQYMWVSVIDGRTSDICLGLNRSIHVYGKGPLPPAHINCRSTIVPLRNNERPDQNTPESLYTWATRQPVELLEELFDKATVDKIKKGKLLAKELEKFEARIAVSIKQFEKKHNKILAR